MTQDMRPTTPEELREFLQDMTIVLLSLMLACFGIYAWWNWPQGKVFAKHEWAIKATVLEETTQGALVRLDCEVGGSPEPITSGFTQIWEDPWRDDARFSVEYKKSWLGDTNWTAFLRVPPKDGVSERLFRVSRGYDDFSVETRKHGIKRHKGQTWAHDMLLRVAPGSSTVQAIEFANLVHYGGSDTASQPGSP